MQYNNVEQALSCTKYVYGSVEARLQKSILKGRNSRRVKIERVNARDLSSSELTFIRKRFCQEFSE